MIKNITAGKGIYVANNSSSTPYINMSNPSAGMVRYNGNSNNFEVYDGSSWMVIQSSYPQIELDNSTQTIIDWAREKMNEETKWKHLAAVNPTLADALAELNRVTEKVKIIAALVETE